MKGYFRWQHVKPAAEEVKEQLPLIAKNVKIQAKLLNTKMMALNTWQVALSVSMVSSIQR